MYINNTTPPTSTRYFVILVKKYIQVRQAIISMNDTITIKGRFIKTLKMIRDKSKKNRKGTCGEKRLSLKGRLK